jgi:type I restriction enzyme M protein
MCGGGDRYGSREPWILGGQARCSPPTVNGAQMPEDKANRLELKQKAGLIWSHVRQKWLVETPEELVRQRYLLVIVNEYGYELTQIAEELNVTGRGAGNARADFVIWRSQQDKLDQKNPLVIVECKSDNVTITIEDYGQGDNYARLSGARFFVTHNSRETKYWRVLHEKMPKLLEEIENVPTANSSDEEIDELVTRLKVFREDEFAELLHSCHTVIRNREKKDPAAAFDEIAKILFVKVWVERELKARRKRLNLFTADFLDSQLGDNPLDTLFQQTKDFYKADEIFEPNERVNLKPATAREIVRRLERYNLSDTSEDVKGIAFERFLGRTFRGEIGQFFTPRTIVEFMIRMIDPEIGETICDPASGSGGFLIRSFEMQRQKLLAEADAAYRKQRELVSEQRLSPKDAARELRVRYAEIQATLVPDRKGSAMWRIANRSIYGVDANDRMARTSKMNMIMHGDGHGGVHHHDGFINVNGIFEGRFDVVLTNPPFGQKVEPDDVVELEDLSPDLRREYEKEYGEAYVHARAKVEAAEGQPIASLFDLPKKPDQKIQTEVLFVERCLDLLKPGGRLGIVLPEGILNNTSLEYVRRFVESRAYILAVVSLPDGAFRAAKASVKASLVFLRKFTDAERQQFVDAESSAKETATEEIDREFADIVSAIQEEIAAAKRAKAVAARKEAQKRLKEVRREIEERRQDLVRAGTREKIDYPIFMYDAKHIGITPTGVADFNELYPNESMPPGLAKTCLELYAEFRDDAEPFLLANL